MSPTSTPEHNAGLEPITAARPAGGNPRESDSYSALQAQIDRLTDIHTDSGVDWSTVASLAVKVLRQEGKDLSVAAWLTMAWFHLRGLQGLADGVHVLKDLVQTYWESMSPPASRLRGRRNQMQWLLDQLTEALQGEFEPMPGPAHAELMADWKELDAAWQTHDDDSPAFYALRRTLEALPVELSSPSETEMASTPATTPHQAVDAAPAANPPPSIRSASEPPPGPGPIDVPAPDADPEAEIDTALAGLRPLVDWCLEAHPELPLLFRLNRICAWASLNAPPPANGNETHVPPPPDQMVASLELMEKGDDAAAVVQFIETRLVDQHFWLDLNRICHSALTRTGARDAAAAVAFETAQLVQRLPGLRALTFNDGRPFADAATQVWLNSLAAGAQSAQDNSGSDALDALKEKADSDAASGKLDAALNVLQTAASQANSARNAFRLRLAQCDLLYRFDATADLRPLLAPLIHELDTYQLLRWEPELARRTLELAATIEQRYSADPEHPSTPMLARLASLDCHAAWRLIQLPAR
jgi:type VI secretion system protein VasJ